MRKFYAVIEGHGLLPVPCDTEKEAEQLAEQIIADTGAELFYEVRELALDSQWLAARYEL